MESKRILIVEDDLYLRDLYCDILRNAGHYVEGAQDGEEGLLKIAKGGWDLILLDIVMPKIDGVEVVRQMQKLQSEKPNGKVVFLTNLGKDSKIEEALSYEGTIGYLIKSQYTPDQLLSEINNFLKT